MNNFISHDLSMQLSFIKAKSDLDRLAVLDQMLHYHLLLKEMDLQIKEMMKPNIWAEK